MEPRQVLDVLPSDARRSNILVLGPTLSETDTIAFDLLTESWTDKRLPFVISAAEAGSQCRSRFKQFGVSSRSVDDLYVIDCTEASESGDMTYPPTCTSTTPADLTGIGICLSKGYDHYGAPGGRVVMVDTISTFLVYSDIDRVYRFINEINGRVTEMGDITVQLLDTDTINAADRNRLVRLFATHIEVQERAGKTAFRLQGEHETEWYEYRPSIEVEE